MAGEHFSAEQIVIIESSNRDWQRHAGDMVEAWIYGYPISGAKWLTARDICGLYQFEGLSILLNSLQGEFSLIVHDKRARRWYVCTSRYGMYSPYYQGNTISSELRSLLQQPKLNIRSIMQYMTFGYGTTAFTIGDTTHIEGIRQFPPATIVEITDGGSTSHQYWSPFAVPIESRLVEKAWFRQELGKHLRNALACGDPPILTLTGGRDTRTFLACYISEGLQNARAFTHGGDDNDVMIAREICQHYHIPHIYYDINPVEGVDYLDGLVSGVSYAPLTEAVKTEAEKGAGVLVLGIAGNEVWRCRLHGRILEELKRVDSPQAIVTALSTSVYFPLLPDVYQMNAEAEMVKDMTATLEGCPHWLFSSPVSLIDYWMWQNACPKWAGTLVKAMGRQTKVFLPKMIKELVEAIYADSVESRTSGALQEYIIAQADPWLANLRYDQSPWINARRKAAHIGGRLLHNRYARKVFGAAMSSQQVSRHDDSYDRIKREMLNYSDMATKLVFDRHKLERYIESNVNPPWIERLVSLELWARSIGLR